MKALNYIAVEGIDGAGKSTQIRMLSNHLVRLNYTPICLLEPTYGAFGRSVRDLISSSVKRDPEAEEILFTNDRIEHVRCKIAPLLNMFKELTPHCGFKILQDRSYFSSPAYQFADESSMAAAVTRQKEFAPAYDVVVLLDISVDLALDRIRCRPGERNPIESREYLDQARRNYLSVAGRERNIVVINGDGTEDEVHTRVKSQLNLERFIPTS